MASTRERKMRTVPISNAFRSKATLAIAIIVGTSALNVSLTRVYGVSRSIITNQSLPLLSDEPDDPHKLLEITVVTYVPETSSSKRNASFHHVILYRYPESPNQHVRIRHAAHLDDNRSESSI